MEIMAKHIAYIGTYAKPYGGVPVLEIDGETCTVFYGPIEFINWSVAVIVPKQDIIKPILPIAIILISMTIIGILIVWFVCKR